jgi:hypothetical protein
MTKSTASVHFSKTLECPSVGHSLILMKLNKEGFLENLFAPFIIDDFKSTFSTKKLHHDSWSKTVWPTDIWTTQ